MTRGKRVFTAAVPRVFLLALLAALIISCSPEPGPSGGNNDPTPPSARVVSTFAGAGSAGFLDSTAGASLFSNPMGITTDGVNLYVSDLSNNRIRQVSLVTGDVTTLAGSGTGAYLDDTGTAAQFWFPQQITTDGRSLYVADTRNRRIRQIVIATGVVTTLAGDW